MIFRKGDFESLPIDQNSIDVVVFSQSLHHAAHPERALAEAAKALATGGRLVTGVGIQVATPAKQKLSLPSSTQKTRILRSRQMPLMQHYTTFSTFYSHSADKFVLTYKSDSYNTLLNI